MDEAAKAVVAFDGRSRWVHGRQLPGRGIGRLEVERAVRPVFVVEAKKPVEAASKGLARGEVATTKLHAPVLLQDRALQPLHKAIGPGTARLGPGVPQAVRATELGGVRTDATVSVVTFDGNGQMTRAFFAGGSFLEVAKHRLEQHELRGNVIATEPAKSIEASGIIDNERPSLT